jgi:hypothetical protein
MYPHRIRLRGPWECEPLAAASANQPLPPPLRMMLPCRWGDGGLGDFAGRVRFRRRFGRPRQLDVDEHVWLTLGGVEGMVALWLNGEPLSARLERPGLLEFEVTSLLQERNELTIEVEAVGGEGGLWGEVALEVRCPAFLRAVQVWMESTEGGRRLHAAGEVVGVSERPLELYVLVERSTVAYGSAEAGAAGKAFHLISEVLPPAPILQVRDPIRVELVCGAMVWYGVDARLSGG